MSCFETRYGAVSVRLEDGSIYLATMGNNSEMGLQLSFDEAMMIGKVLLYNVINAPEPNKYPRKRCELEADLEYFEGMKGDVEMWLRSIEVKEQAEGAAGGRA